MKSLSVFALAFSLLALEVSAKNLFYFDQTNLRKSPGDALFNQQNPPVFSEEKLKVEQNVNVRQSSTKLKIHSEQSRFFNNVAECDPEDQVAYTAAVLEFEPYTQWTATDTGEGILDKNVDSIAQYAQQAKALGVDIFVAPEYSVQGLNMYTDDTEKMMSLTQIIPDPADGVIPCTDTQVLHNYKAMQRLSCLARDLSMYLVIDLAEQETQAEGDLLLFNAQIVFDREGCVIAKYHKQNLYLEPQFTPGAADDSQALFDTDFGVRFSLQVCFDIAFEHPGYNNSKFGGVRDIVMSTAWVDETPFIYAINVQNGWSRSMSSNLMVAGYHWPERTKLGSGIYRGFSDLTNTYTYDPDSGDVLVVSPVLTCKSVPANREPVPIITEPRIIELSRRSLAKEGRVHNMLHEDLSIYNRSVLSPTALGESKTKTLCHNDDFCCTLTYEHSKSDLVYMMLTTSDHLIIGDGAYKIYFQVCAVVWCIDENYQTCGRTDLKKPHEDVFGPFKVEAAFSSEEVLPIVFLRNMTVAVNDLYHSSNEGSVYTVVNEKGFESLLSGGLFGRWFGKD